MTATKIFWAIGDFLYGFPFEFYDWVGNKFNYSCIVLGFVGLIYWLRLQNKFDKEAQNNTNKLR